MENTAELELRLKKAEEELEEFSKKQGEIDAVAYNSSNARQSRQEMFRLMDVVTKLKYDLRKS